MSITIAQATRPAEDAVFVVQPGITNADAGRIGFNIIDKSWYNYTGTPFRLPRTTILCPVEAVTQSGRRAALPESGIYRDGFWTGGTVHVYRVSNGTLSKVRTSSIVDDASSFWRRRRVFTGASAGVPFDDWEKPSAAQWFAVRAYDTNGDVGPLSNVVNLNTPATWTGDRTSATSSVSPSLTGAETGSLGAPVISASWASGEDVLSVSIDTAASGSPAGYVLYISDEDPATHEGFYIEVEDDGGSAIQAGDLLVATVLVVNPKPDMLTNRVYRTDAAGRVIFPLGAQTAYDQNWRTDDPDNTFAWGETGGEKFAEYTITAPNSDTYLTLAKYSGQGTSGNTPIPASGDVWRLELDAQAASATTIQVAVDNASLYGATITAVDGSPVSETSPYVLSIGTERATHTIEITWGATPARIAIDRIRLIFDQISTVSIFNWSVSFAPAESFGLTPENKTRVEAARPAFIRDHSFVKTNELGKAYDLRGLILNFLHASLANTVAIGCQTFWLQPELWDVDDYPLLADYLCGDGTDPWSALRVSLGRAAPWTDDLGIWFELSNETWNTVLGFYTFPQMIDVADSNRVIEGFTGETYGRFSELFYQALVTQAATHGAASAFTHVLGGRHVTDYGDVAARFAPSATLVTRAPYMRGWEVGAGGVTESPQGFQETLLWPGTVTLDRLADSETWLGQARANGANTALTAGTYEDAISFSVLPSSGAPIPIGERRFAKTRAGATAYLDKIATQFAQYAVQAHFTLNYGDDWSTHDPVSGRAWPYHQWLEVWNEHCAGALREHVAVVRPLKASVSVSGDDYVNVPEVACHIMQTATGWAAVVVNRNLPYDSIDSGDALYDAGDDGSRTVKVVVPPGSYTLRKYTMTGAWNAQNFDDSEPTYDASIDVSETVVGANGGEVTATLAAASAEVWVWGDD